MRSKRIRAWTPWSRKRRLLQVSVLGKVELPELLYLREEDTRDLNSLGSWEKGNLSPLPHFFFHIIRNTNRTLI